MTLCLADSIFAGRRLDLPDFGGAAGTTPEAWLRDGCFIGNTDRDSTGNGSLIRLAPVAIHDRHSRHRSRGQAASRPGVTHDALDGEERVPAARGAAAPGAERDRRMGLPAAEARAPCRRAAS